MNLREAIVKIIEDSEGKKEIYSKICRVVSVDKEENTLEAEPIDGDANILDVRIGVNNGQDNEFLVYPSINSNVLITFINKNEAFVSSVSQVEEVVFNGGKNGGLININTLIAELQKNTAILTQIKAVVSAPIIETGNGSPSALGAALNSALSSLETGVFTNMEDEKFKH